MASEQTLVAAITPDVKTKADLRLHQFKAVRIHGAGVDLANGTDANSGPVYVLWNKPNSGQAATLVGPPNVVKAVAGAAVIRNNFITINTSAYFITGSAGSIPLVGNALSAVASGSIFDLHVKG